MILNFYHQIKHYAVTVKQIAKFAQIHKIVNNVIQIHGIYKITNV